MKKTLLILGLGAVPLVQAPATVSARPLDCGPCAPGCCATAVQVEVEAVESQACPPGCCVVSAETAAIGSSTSPQATAIPAPAAPTPAPAPATTTESCCGPCPPKCC